MLDASAGVEIVAETVRGRALRLLLPSGVELIVPEHFFAEVGAVLRPWELSGVLTPRQAAEALRQLVRWPLRRASLTSLLAKSWPRTSSKGS